MEVAPLSNNYLTIAKRSIAANKKRSFLVILGIILSVALVTAMGIFFYSAEQRAVESYRVEGDYHLQYTNIEAEEKNIIEKFATVEKYGFFDLIGIGQIGSSYGKVIEADEESIKVLGYELQGRLPESEDEIVISKNEWIRYGVSTEIGDTIKISLDDEEEEPMQIVGILNSKGYMDTNYIIQQRNKNVTKCAVVKFKEDKNLRRHIDDLNSKITSSNKETEIDERDSFLTILGAGKYENVNESYNTIVLILSSIVIFSTVIMIFNAFNISVTERMKEYGLLKAVGSTPSQIRNLVLVEAGILGLIGIPLGLFIGYFGLDAFMTIFGKYFIKGIGDIEILFSIKMILQALILGIVTVFLSALLPTITAGKISPLECMNNSTVKITKVPKGAIWNKLLKIEGLIAFRNRKINKKRYYITILAMTISIALFITMSATLRTTFDTFSGYNEVFENGDIIVSVGSDEYFNGNKDLMGIGKKLKNDYDIINEVVNNYVEPMMISYGKSESFEGVNNSRLYEDKTNINNEEYRAFGVIIKPIDKSHENYLKKYMGEFSYDNIVKEKGVIVINGAKGFSAEDEKYKNTSLMNVEIGDSIYLTPYTESTEQYDYEEIKSDKHEVKVSHILSINNVNDIVTIIVPIETLPFDYYKYKVTRDENSTEYIDKSGKLDEVHSIGLDIVDNFNIKELNLLRENLETEFTENAYINDKIADREENRKRELTVNVFVYCFIAIVCLISALNIINTVSTNIILRKRELSGLRAIGTSYEAMRNMLLIEGAMYGGYSAILGSIVGTGLSYILTKLMFGVMEGTFVLPIREIVIAFIGAIILGIIAILIPLKKIKEISIIDGIRNLD